MDPLYKTKNIKGRGRLGCIMSHGPGLTHPVYSEAFLKQHVEVQ